MSILKNLGDDVPITISAATLLGIVGSSIYLTNRIKRLEDYVYTNQEKKFIDNDARINEIEEHLSSIVPLVDPEGRQKSSKSLAIINELNIRMNKLENELPLMEYINLPQKNRQAKQSVGYTRYTKNNNVFQEGNIPTFRQAEGRPMLSTRSMGYTPSIENSELHYVTGEDEYENMKPRYFERENSQYNIENRNATMRSKGLSEPSYNPVIKNKKRDSFEYDDNFIDKNGKKQSIRDSTFQRHDHSVIKPSINNRSEEYHDTSTNSRNIKQHKSTDLRQRVPTNGNIEYGTDRKNNRNGNLDVRNYSRDNDQNSDMDDMPKVRKRESVMSPTARSHGQSSSRLETVDSKKKPSKNESKKIMIDSDDDNIKDTLGDDELDELDDAINCLMNK